VNLATNGDGVESFNTIVSCGANIVPHRTLSLNINFSDQRIKQSGGGRQDSSTFTQSGTLSAAWNPVSTISLFASVGYAEQQETPVIVTKVFGGSWNPFPDGALQLSISYNESLTSTGNQTVKSLSPTMRWNIRPGWWLDVSYSYQTITSTTNETTANTASSSLRLSF
jgi:7-cyano-7-deazaguanine synthase in queuosine biosynthesis